MKTLYIDESQCSSGKTTRINLNAKIDLLRGKSTLIVKPSTESINQSYKAILALDVSKMECHAIHSETHPTAVIKTIEAHLDSNSPKILLITQASFHLLLLNGLSKKPDWNLVFDEVISIYDLHGRKYIENTEEAKSILSRLFTCSEEKGYINLKSNECDRTDAYTYDLDYIIRPSSSKFFDVYLQEIEEEGSYHTKFHTVMNTNALDYFGDCYLYAAKCSNSLMYQIWSKSLTMKVMPDGIFKKHNLNLTVYNPNIDKFSAKYDKSNPLAKIEFINMFKTMVKGQDHLVLDNNSSEIKYELTHIDHRLDHNCAGVNHFQHISNVGCFSSLNPNPYEMMFIEKMYGINRSEQKKIRHAETFYQVIMRTILRSQYYSGEEVKAFVMSREFAYMMDEYFHNITHVELEVTGGKIKNTLTRGELNKASCIRKEHGLDSTEWKTKALMTTKLWDVCSQRGKLDALYSQIPIEELLVKGEK